MAEGISVTKLCTPTMVRQELEYSCGAACVRQLLREAGHEVAESIIRDALGADFDPQRGTQAEPLADVLNRLDPSHRYIGGPLRDLEHFEVLLEERAPFLAMVARHWVIVDRRERAQIVIRDPGTGAARTIGTAEFRRQWAASYNRVVFRDLTNEDSVPNANRTES